MQGKHAGVMWRGQVEIIPSETSMNGIHEGWYGWMGDRVVGWLRTDGWRVKEERGAVALWKGINRSILCLCLWEVRVRVRAVREREQ